MDLTAHRQHNHIISVADCSLQHGIFELAFEAFGGADAAPGGKCPAEHRAAVGHFAAGKAAPDQFIPPLPGWEDRSLFIAKVGSVGFHHYDPYSQTLAKIERGHEQDREDAQRMVSDGLVDTDELMRLFEAIEPDLYRYPAIDPASFRAAVVEFVASRGRAR